MTEGAVGCSGQYLRYSRPEVCSWTVSGCVQSSSSVFEFAHFDRLECLDCNSNLQYFFVDCAAISLGLNQTSMFK